MEEAIVKNGEVEVTSEEEGFKGAWYRATLVDNPTKSGRKKLTIRYLTLLNEDGSTPLTETIEQKFIRPVPPVDLYDGVVLEKGSVVDADHKDGWWTGVVIQKLEHDNFLVYFDYPPDIIQFDKTQLRAHLRWTGWKWVRPEIEELSKSEFAPGTLVEICYLRDNVEVAWFPAMIVKEIEEVNEIDIAKESVSPITPSRVVTTTPLKQTEAETEGKKSPEKNQNGLGNDSAQNKMPEDKDEEENSQDKNRKRKREEEHNNSETDGTSNGSKAEINVIYPEISPDQSSRDITVLPFAKKSPFWKNCESMKGFKSQSPHFSPLFEVQEDLREWSAVGMMVTFYGLLDEIKDLQLDVDSTGRLNSLSESFAAFEKHGFDVATPQLRISKMLSLTNEQGKKAEERKRFEKKIEEEDSERRRFEEEMARLKDKILMLTRQEAYAKEKKEAAEEKIVKMKSIAERIDEEIEDVKLQFQKTVSAPWK